MDTAQKPLPDCLEYQSELQHILAEQEALIEEQSAQIESQDSLLKNKDSLLKTKDTRIQHLEEQLRLLRQKRFGSSSEKVSVDQLDLNFNEAECDADIALTEDDTAPEAIDTHTSTVTAHQRKTKRARVALPEHLPREEVVYDLADADKLCPHDQTPLELIGESTHEQLDVIPAQYRVITHRRKQYACPCCKDYIATADKPKQAIEKSLASASLLADVATWKYRYGLPLHRQAALFSAQGISMSTTNLANWMVKCGALVQPLVNCLIDTVKEQAVVHIDETPVQVLNEPNKSAHSKSYMWVMTSTESPAVIYHYSANRSQATATALLGDYQGAFMCDAYVGYDALESQQHITRLGCWAHARRKFTDAKRAKSHGKTGKIDQAIAYIQKLYQIERMTKDKPADQRYNIRQQQAKPVIDKMKHWLDKSLKHVPPKSKLGEALGYLHNQWHRLIGYLDDGRYPIDNNTAENAIRPFVIGRKNWLFSTSQAGARASANLYSLVQSAKANGLEPRAYLEKVFSDLPNATSLKDIEALLPHNV